MYPNRSATYIGEQYENSMHPPAGSGCCAGTSSRFGNGPQQMLEQMKQSMLPMIEQSLPEMDKTRQCVQASGNTA